MKRSEAFVKKGEKIHNSFKLGGRGTEDRWRLEYTDEQLQYLWSHGYLEYDAPNLQYGELTSVNYIKFSKTGRRWRDWYAYPIGFYIKYEILGWAFWKYKVIHPFMRKVFHKRYDYDEYNDWDGNYDTL